MKYQMKGNYFNGNYVWPSLNGPGAVEHFIKRECPADTETLLWQMAVDYSHVEPVVNSATRGYKFWRALPVAERIPFLKRYQEQLLAKKDLIAEAISLESGKPLWEATGEVNSVIGKVDITIKESLPRIKDKSYPEIMPRTTGHLFYKPLGPTLIIGAFNFPCHLANTQILSALITGNSIIFKPSEKVAYSAQLLTNCFHEAGFPKGVVNLIQGDGETARRLLNEKAIKGIYFTGSKEIGSSILKNTYQDFSKLVALELGGKNPAILHKDANLENALAELISGAFLTTGQRCTSTSTIIIHRSIMDEFISRYHEVAKKIIIDHPIDHKEEPLMGPLVDQRALENYLLFMGMAKREGLEEIMRGKQLTDKKHRGYYVSPSIHLVPNFDPQSHFLQSEIFGPNCTFIPYNELEEAIEIANFTEYGLAACVFSSDRSVFEKCYREIETGLINFNRSTCGASPKLPFGGVKNSGNYRPMAVASIDATVYQMVSLEALDSNKTLKDIKGLRT